MGEHTGGPPTAEQQAGLDLLEAAWRAQPSLLAAAMAALWRAKRGHRCVNCAKLIDLSPGAGAPYWYHPSSHSSVWCDGWGDPHGTGQQATPAEGRRLLDGAPTPTWPEDLRVREHPQEPA